MAAFFLVIGGRPKEVWDNHELPFNHAKRHSFGFFLFLRGEGRRVYLLGELAGVQRWGIQGDKDIVALAVVGRQAQLPGDDLPLLDMQWGLHQAPQLEPAGCVI